MSEYLCMNACVWVSDGRGVFHRREGGKEKEESEVLYKNKNYGLMTWGITRFFLQATQNNKGCWPVRPFV